MPYVHVENTISSDINSVWNIVSKIEDYPQVMPSVNSVQVEKEEGHVSVSHWNVSLRESIMCWTEKDIQDPKNYRIDFEQTDGDLAEFKGHWQLKTDPSDTNKTIASLAIEFDIGIPALEDILNPIAIDALHENSNSMLNSIAAYWEGVA